MSLSSLAMMSPGPAARPSTSSPSTSSSWWVSHPRPAAAVNTQSAKARNPAGFFSPFRLDL